MVVVLLRLIVWPGSISGCPNAEQIAKAFTLELNIVPNKQRTQTAAEPRQDYRSATSCDLFKMFNTVPVNKLLLLIAPVTLLVAIFMQWPSQKELASVLVAFCLLRIAYCQSNVVSW